MMNVACVFTPSAIYRADWVRVLAAQVEKYLKRRHRFVCLTSHPDGIAEHGIECIPLAHDWSGWWSKVELFRPGLFDGPVLYLDLDVFAQAPLDDLVRETAGITFWDDPYAPGHINTSVMSWSGDYSVLYHVMDRSTDQLQRKFASGDNCRFGDQGYIEDVLRTLKVPFDLYEAGRVVSFKANAREKPPEGARVVAFHGKPKMPDATGWPAAKWQRLLSNL